MKVQVELNESEVALAKKLKMSMTEYVETALAAYYQNRNGEQRNDAPAGDKEQVKI